MNLAVFTAGTTNNNFYYNGVSSPNTQNFERKRKNKTTDNNNFYYYGALTPNDYCLFRKRKRFS